MDNKTFAAFIDYVRTFQSSTDIPVVTHAQGPAVQDGGPDHVVLAKVLVPSAFPPRGLCLPVCGERLLSWMLHLLQPPQLISDLLLLWMVTFP